MAEVASQPRAHPCRVKGVWQKRRKERETIDRSGVGPLGIQIVDNGLSKGLQLDADGNHQQPRRCSRLRMTRFRMPVLPPRRPREKAVWRYLKIGLDYANFNVEHWPAGAELPPTPVSSCSPAACFATLRPLSHESVRALLLHEHYITPLK